MKSKNLISIATLIIFMGVLSARGQDVKNFPFDPLVILKAWNYTKLNKVMGKGEEVISKLNNQDYISGLRYKYDLLGKQGVLEFSFTQDSISRFLFRFDHAKRVINVDHSDRRTRDPAASHDFDLAVQKLDSLQRLDSISRDTLIRGISEVMDRPVSNGPTPVTEKLARHSAIWINHGYSCQYKDYVDYSEIIFTLPTVPLWAVSEFSIPKGTQIIQKVNVNTRKMSCTVSLMGFTSNASRIAYSDYFLLVEFSGGQRYLANYPKNATDYLLSQYFVEFAGGQRCLMSIPENSIGYLPTMLIEDCDGDAIPEIWIQGPCDKGMSHYRHIIYSIQMKEPVPIFDTNDFIPQSISIAGNSKATILWPDGNPIILDLPKPVQMADKLIILHPNGLKYLKSTKLNSDGSTNFIGGLEIKLSPESPTLGIIEITFKHTRGAWEVEKTIFLPPLK